MCFPVNFAKYVITPILQIIYERLHLYFVPFFLGILQNRGNYSSKDTLILKVTQQTNLDTVNKASKQRHKFNCYLRII